MLLNEIQQGWSGEATSFTAPGSLGVTFDGIPIVYPATGLWQSAAMPQSLTMQNLEVTYGPGQPMDRWYTNVGGQVEFTPVQPTLDRHLSAAVTAGPYGQQNFAFVGNTGSFRGWSTVLGGGWLRARSMDYGLDKPRDVSHSKCRDVPGQDRSLWVFSCRLVRLTGLGLRLFGMRMATYLDQE